MSNTIRRYEPPEDRENAVPMEVAGFVGGEELGAAVQLTLQAGPETKYTTLSEKQVLDLIVALSKRLAMVDGHAATDPFDPPVVQPDGTKEIIEKW